MTVICIVFLLAGLALELALAHETLAARATLRDAVARASPIAQGVGHDDAKLLADVRASLARHELAPPATLLAARAEAAQSCDARRLASLAAASIGAFGEAARQAELAARLAPGDAAARQEAEDAVDAALLGRVRTPARILGGAAVLFLLLAALHAARRRHRGRLRARWLDGVRGRMSVSVDGRREAGGAWLSSDARVVSVDVFLRAADGPCPGPGPTLGLVLSHAASSRSLRLTPVRDVQGDAVRTRLKDATLARVLERPGTWRLEARLDGRAIAEHHLEVAAPSPGPARRLLHLVGRA
jgi:hypothetical protein